MADLIDRQKLIKWFDDWYENDEFPVGYIVRIINDQPSVAEPVVRCKDCKHHIFDGDRWLCKLLSNNYEPVVEMDDDDFCSQGERKDD